RSELLVRLDKKLFEHLDAGPVDGDFRRLGHFRKLSGSHLVEKVVVLFRQELQVRSLVEARQALAAAARASAAAAIRLSRSKLMGHGLIWERVDWREFKNSFRKAPQNGGFRGSGH